MLYSFMKSMLINWNVISCAVRPSGVINKRYFLIKHFIINALTGYTYRLNTVNTYIFIQWNTAHMHTFIQAVISAQAGFFSWVFFSCVHTFILVWKLWMDHLASFFLGVHLLWCMKRPLVAPQSTYISSASIAFCPVDCDATYISSMESNTR